MITRRNNLQFHRWVVGLLLVVYGSAGGLGYGLHAVWECEHHCCEHSNSAALAHEHSPDCHQHHDHGVVATDRSDKHATLELACAACPICEFLAQAQTPLVMEFTTACTDPAISILASLDSIYVAPESNVSSARGPPLG
jgi:hypothetical protein